MRTQGSQKFPENLWYLGWFAWSSRILSEVHTQQEKKSKQIENTYFLTESLKHRKKAHVFRPSVFRTCLQPEIHFSRPHPSDHGAADAEVPSAFRGHIPAITAAEVTSRLVPYGFHGLLGEQVFRLLKGKENCQRLTLRLVALWNPGDSSSDWSKMTDWFWVWVMGNKCCG